MFSNQSQPLTYKRLREQLQTKIDEVIASGDPAVVLEARLNCDEQRIVHRGAYAAAAAVVEKHYSGEAVLNREELKRAEIQRNTFGAVERLHEIALARLEEFS